MEEVELEVMMGELVSVLLVERVLVERLLVDM